VSDAIYRDIDGYYHFPNGLLGRFVGEDRKFMVVGCAETGGPTFYHIDSVRGVGGIDFQATVQKAWKTITPGHHELYGEVGG
jgi:hypothetical protein